MFHKIFCASNYGMGKKVSEQIKYVQNQLDTNQLTPSLLRHTVKYQIIMFQVEDLGMFITQIVDTMFMSFNFGKQETRQIMPFCRLSAEKYNLNRYLRYLFLRLYDKIYPLYSQFYSKDDETFKKRVALILENHTLSSIKAKYQISEVAGLYMQSADDTSKFDSAVSEINKLTIMHTPREKLRCFQIMNSILKGNPCKLNQP